MSLLLAVSHDKTFPIKDAITVGSPCNFDAFLWNGWDIDQQVEMDGPPALGYAVRNKTLVTWFLANGANPNAGSNYDNAFSRAALLGEPEVIELLLSHGANVDHGQVLHWAVERQHDACEVVKLLMDRGAPLHRLEYDGTAPMWSVLGLRSRGLGSPLHNAIAQGKVDVASTLLDGGADPDFVDTKGKTCRDLARESSKTAAFTLLGL
ncbi:uncharacterized protein RCC_06663 [Ramularia collo-cygni]|uniref:Uncharacterized protein n=1 Tax=Ramularia collo-cygni TaxID=112498 RepID=A0A2D3V247_9PEZI|nr:uncharacterized protein RCC_06663 [Ramularia collo-cygni]CZT20805.1 uncharacterized protein RCC_06663 [Ramularia collo-cygni]